MTNSYLMKRLPRKKFPEMDDQISSEGYMPMNISGPIFS